jgi:sterol desaturase/sphingolipid hydroxylase (fatty acid hydroxylase superfamily)
MNWEAFFRNLQLIGTRYFVLALIAFILFYVLFRNKWLYKKIQQRFPKNKDYAREILYSVTTMIIFALVSSIVFTHPRIRPYTTMYTDINQFGWVYYFAAFPIMLFIHDTYFYWCHRLMHHKKIFNYVHLVHHQSTNPSPWAAYAFHPLEAFIEIGILFVFVFTIPIHKTHLLIFFLFMIVYNVYGHLGYELYPKGFGKHWFGRWINTSVNHNQHHQYFKGNYGLYFLFWDRILGTIREDYEERFDEVKQRPTPL